MTSFFNDIHDVHEHCETSERFAVRGQDAASRRKEKRRKKRRAIVERVVGRYALVSLKGCQTVEDAEQELYGSWSLWWFVWSHRDVIWLAIRFLARRWFESRNGLPDTPGGV